MDFNQVKNQLDYASAVPLPRAEDEIALSDLLRIIWSGRALIVLIPLLAMAATALAIGALSLRIDEPTVYFVELRGIENSRYPNGTAFSPRDLVAPAILEELRRRYNIPDDTNLRDGITVTFGHPATIGLHRLYEEKLAVSNLSPAEITSINEEYRTQLKSVTESALRIEVNHQLLGLSPDDGAVIAQALPELWSQHFSENVRIFEDTRLSRVEITSSSEDLRTTASILNARQRLQIMDQGLALMSGDNRLALLQTSDGETIGDLRQALQRFRTVQFDPVMAAQFQADDFVGSAYIKSLQLKLGELRMKMASYDDALQELYKFQNSAVTVAAQSDSSFLQNSLQITDTGLSEIVELAKRANLSDFTRQMLEEKQKIGAEIAEIESELQKVIQDAKAASTPDFRDNAAETLASLTRSYSELVKGAKERLRTQAGKLYSSMGLPYTVGATFPKRAILAIILAGGFAALLTVIFVLVRASLRAHRPT